MKGRVFFGVALFLSLALNLFFLGGMSHPRGMHDRHRPEPFDRMMVNAEKLAEPARSQVKQIIASYRPALAAQMVKMRESREELQKLLKSDSYSRAKADAQFEAMQAEMGKMQDIAKAMMLDVNDKLSPAERVNMMPAPHDGKEEKADDAAATSSDSDEKQAKVIHVSHHAAPEHPPF